MLDHQLVTAASNAISILNYGSLLTLFDFQFSEAADWSRCRVPHANLNMAVFPGCNFDEADLSDASVFCANATRCTFRGAKLKDVRLYESRTCCEPLHAIVHDMVRFSADSAYLAVIRTCHAPIVLSTNLRHKLVFDSYENRRYIRPPVAFSPAEKVFAIGGANPGARFDVCDLSSGSLGVIRHELDANFEQRAIPTTRAYSRDGSLLATFVKGSSNGELRLWDVREGYRVIHSSQHPAVGYIVFSDDGSSLYAIGVGNGEIGTKYVVTVIDIQSRAVRVRLSTQTSTSMGHISITLFTQGMVIFYWYVQYGTIQSTIYRVMPSTFWV